MASGAVSASTAASCLFTPTPGVLLTHLDKDPPKPNYFSGPNRHSLLDRNWICGLPELICRPVFAPARVPSPKAIERGGRAGGWGLRRFLQRVHCNTSRAQSVKSPAPRLTDHEIHFNPKPIVFAAIFSKHNQRIDLAVNIAGLHTIFWIPDRAAVWYLQFLLLCGKHFSPIN